MDDGLSNRSGLSRHRKYSEYEHANWIVDASFTTFATHVAWIYALRPAFARTGYQAGLSSLPPTIINFFPFWLLDLLDD